MKLWWAANIYWLTLIAYLSVQLLNYRYEDGNSINPLAIVSIIIAICVMIAEFQFAWYMWAAEKTYKSRKEKFCF